MPVAGKERGKVYWKGESRVYMLVVGLAWVGLASTFVSEPPLPLSLPPHLTGKNWAVAQGADVAKGDYLLFADSDVTLYPGAIDDFVASMTKANVGWVSFLPKTTFSCFAE